MSPNVIGPLRKDIAHLGLSKVVFGVACTLRTMNQRGPNLRIRAESSAELLPASFSLARLSTTRSRSASVCRRPIAQKPALERVR